MILSRTIFLLFVLCTTANLSSSSPILETDATAAQLLLVNARIDGLQAKTEQLSIQLEEEKAQRINLQAVNEELVTKNRKLEEKVDFLMIKITKTNKQQEEISPLKNTNADIIEPKNNKKIIASPKAPPSSCRQLSTIGHYLDGIYLVANSETKKIEAVYCDFGSSILSETFYGSVDVKSKSVHFTVQRTRNFDLENAIIPFDIERLNVGGAMNLATGVFIAPVDGIYHFEFRGLKYANNEELFIYLQVNGVNMGSAYATYLPNYLGLSGISASLKLKAGDQIRLFKTTGILHEQYTFFTGWLVEEDLVLE